MGKSEWMSMARMDLCLRRYEWAFGGFAVGKSQRMSMERTDLCPGRYEWAFGGLTVGKSQRMPTAMIVLFNTFVLAPTIK